MALIDLILQQKIIVLSIGFAMLFMMAAALLIIIPRVRRFLRLLAEVRARIPEPEQPVQVQEQEYREEIPYDLPDPVVDRTPMPPTAQQISVAPNEAAKAELNQVQTISAQDQTQKSAGGEPVKVNKVETTEGEEEKKPEETKKEEKSAGDTVSSAMQDILSSVFADDEANARYDTLLEDTEKVDASELAVFCQQISDQLRDGVTA